MCMCCLFVCVFLYIYTYFVNMCLCINKCIYAFLSLCVHVFMFVHEGVIMRTRDREQ